RRGFGQGRRREVHHRGEPGGRARRPGAARRVAGRGHLRTLAPADAGRAGAAPHRRPAHHPAPALGPPRHVHRLPGGGGHGDDLARPHGDGRAGAAHGAGRVGRARHHGGGHAARHRRRPAHHESARALGRGGDRVHAAGRGADRRPARGADVRAGERARAGRGGEHVGVLLPQLRTPRGDLRPGRRAAGSGAARRGVPRRAAVGAFHPGAGRRGHPDRGGSARHGRGRDLSPHRRAAVGEAARRGRGARGTADRSGV
ncbi:MAG: [4Fe-4S] cluster assembly scaffold protein Mrp (ApbC), partial [uncultured Acetobacteraceae bacterium]